VKRKRERDSKRKEGRGCPVMNISNSKTEIDETRGKKIAGGEIGKTAAIFGGKLG